MVSNYDRIFSEIRKEANRVEKDHGVSADDLMNLVMEIVNIQDQHLNKKIHINRSMQNMIEQAARKHVANQKGHPC